MAVEHKVSEGSLFFGVDPSGNLIPLNISASGGINSELSAGERQTSSETLSYVSVKEDWNYTVVDLSDNSTTVSAAPTIIGNVWVNTALSAHACPIKDDTVTVRSLDASSAVNTEFLGMKGTRFETSLIVDPDDAATGLIVVQWRLI